MKISHRASALLFTVLSVVGSGCGPDDGGLDGGVDGGADAPTGPRYLEEDRTIDSGGDARTYLLVRPDDETLAALGALPIVIAFHGDGGTGRGLHGSMPFERPAGASGVFAVYPDAMGGTFEYYSDAGRAREVALVQDLIAALSAEFSVDASRIHLAGFSGGATLANAVGCRLGNDVIASMGIHSGTLYPVDPPDFAYTDTGGVDCALPRAILVWGTTDGTDVGFAQGQSVRNNYLRTAGCADVSAPWSLAPCITYPDCEEAVVWCPIDGMGHAIWPGATAAMWRYFSE